MSKLVLMVGLQGSGKSTKAYEISHRSPNYCPVVLSSDEYRKKYGYEISNDKLFKKIYQKAKEWLNIGQDVIIDATNVTRKSRKSALDYCLGEGVKAVAYILSTPYEQCKQQLELRNKTSNRTVPIEALERYHKAFEIPFFEEGFDEIIVDKWDDFNTQNYVASKEIDEQMINFDQQNKWHKFTVGEHCKRCGDIVYQKTHDNVLFEAANFHDIGKLFTQTFTEDGNAHYYSHANIGTYYLLSHTNILNLLLKEDVLDCLFYINYHMLAHDIKTPKSVAKYKKIFGDKKYKNLMILRKADGQSRE